MPIHFLARVTVGPLELVVGNAPHVPQHSLEKVEPEELVEWTLTVTVLSRMVHAAAMEFARFSKVGYHVTVVGIDGDKMAIEEIMYIWAKKHPVLNRVNLCVPRA